MLEKGIAAAQMGHKEEACEILQKILTEEPRNEMAWYWLAAVLEKEDAIICLKNVLRINPANQEARAALAKLRKDQAQKANHSITNLHYDVSERRRSEEMASWIEYVAQLYQQGQTRKEITLDLNVRGLDFDYANLVVQNFFKQRKKAGLRKMMYGGTGCMGGIVVGVILFLTLFMLTGNVYVLRITLLIVGGTIVGGIVWFIGGLLQLLDW